MEAIQKSPLEEQLTESIATLETIAAGSHPESQDLPKVAGHIAEALRLSLVTMAASLGECHQGVPYSALHPVLDMEGRFQWCCNHDPPHCSAPQ